MRTLHEIRRLKNIEGAQILRTTLFPSSKNYLFVSIVVVFGGKFHVMKRPPALQDEVIRDHELLLQDLKVALGDGS